MLDGPRCADGLTWWNVQSTSDSNLTGWTVEGAAGDYFLEPPFPSTVIEGESVLSLAQLKLWEANNTLLMVEPISRTTLHVLDEAGYREIEMSNPFEASETDGI